MKKNNFLLLLTIFTFISCKNSITGKWIFTDVNYSSEIDTSGGNLSFLVLAVNDTLIIKDHKYISTTNKTFSGDWYFISSNKLILDVDWGDKIINSKLSSGVYGEFEVFKLTNKKLILKADGYLGSVEYEFVKSK